MPKEGKWLYMEDKYGQDGWRCSICKFFIPWYYSYYKNADFIANYHYCPRCSSKMISHTGDKNAQPVITIYGRQ